MGVITNGHEKRVEDEEVNGPHLVEHGQDQPRRRLAHVEAREKQQASQARAALRDPAGFITEASQCISGSPIQRKTKRGVPTAAARIATHQYGEDVRDLLTENQSCNAVTVRELDGELVLVGATQLVVKSGEEMMDALERGSQMRVTASTHMNDT